MMDRDNRLFSAIDLIYACTLDPDLWPTALDAVATAMDGAGAFLLWGSLEQGLRTIASPRIAEGIRLYQEVWWKHDLRNQRIVERGLLFAGRPVVDDDLVNEEDRRTHPFFRDFVNLQGWPWCVAAPVMTRPKFPVVLSVQGSTERGRFGVQDKETCALFARHIERALLVSMQLIEQSDLGMTLAEALGRMRRGVFLVGEGCELVYANANGRALLGEGLVQRAGRLGAQLPADETKLLRAVEAIQAGADHDRMRPPFAVRRPGRASPLAVHVLPIGRKEVAIRDILRRSIAIVVAIDPAIEIEVDPNLLREVMGLSPAEARVAAVVGAGRTPAEAAARLGLKEQTVRSSLKKIYSKLGITRQGELIARVANLV